MREIPDHTLAHNRPLGRICYNLTHEEAVLYRNAGEDALDEHRAKMDGPEMEARHKRVVAGPSALIEVVGSTYGHHPHAVLGLVLKHSDFRAEAVERAIKKMLGNDQARIDEFLAGGDEQTAIVSLREIKEALSEYGPPTAEWAD